MNYAEAKAFLAGGRNKNSRPIENHTRVEVIDAETIGIRLHDTYVVKIHSDGSWQLYSGGWYTVTTKDRINRYAPSPTVVFSERGRWYVGRYGQMYPAKSDPGSVPFFDGIAVDASGTVLNPRSTTVSEERERKVIERNLASYIKGFIAKLSEGMELPSNGDCWFCSFVGDDGKTWGDSSHSDHLLSHISVDERYYVPTLLFNAVKERGYGDWNFVMSMRLDMDAYAEGKGQLKLRRAWGSTSEPDQGSAREFARDLRRYLKKRVLPGGGVTPAGVGVTAVVGSGYYGI